MRGGDVILLHDGGFKAMGADRSHSVEASEPSSVRTAVKVAVRDRFADDGVCHKALSCSSLS